MPTPRESEEQARLREEWDRRLDEMLEETFPASDPPSTHTGGGRDRAQPEG